jgi:Condensation domain
MLSRTPQTDSIEPLPLSPVDNLFWSVGERFGGARIVLILRLDGCIEADYLAPALTRLQRRHPKLRAAIVRGRDGRNRYHFDPPPPPIPFEIADYDTEETPWREETRRLLKVGFPAAGPLAGVTILRSRAHARSELLLSVHHAIADGRSALMLVDDLLTEYANAEANLDSPPRPVLPAVTADHAVASGGWRSRLWMLRRMVRLQREDRRSRLTVLPESPDIPPQSQWVHWVYSREDTLRLVRRCRKEGTSFGGAQLAAACCGLMECLTVPTGMFKCQFPFDLREELQGSPGRVTAQDLGCFLSTMNEYYEVPQRSAFWDLARRAHHDLQGFVQQGGPSLYFNLAQTGSNRLLARATPRAIQSNARRITLLATNYGVVNVRDTYGSLRPRECTLTFKNDVIGPSLVMEALVMGQRLNIGLCAESLEPAFWDKLQTAIRKHFDDAVGGETTQPQAARAGCAN